ncbi:acyl-CoA N-acyltransferase [Thozetella sp. PMI_491]|nr:acyl-CoA N-acyltransferase [Thozetella sp. PMI_491]
MAAPETTEIPLFKAFYEIKTPRLIIRSAVPEDAEPVYRLLSSPDNNPHTPVDPELSPEVFSRRIARWKETAETGVNAFMVIASRETGELVGFGGFNSLPKKPALDGSGQEVLVGDIGVMIDKKQWRKGYATEAICAKTEFGFSHFGCGFMFLDTGKDNEPVRALMKALHLDHVESTKQSAFDKDDWVWLYEYDKATWERAKAQLKEEGKWPL